MLAHNASPLFRFTPYILFACMWLAAGMVPIIATDLPFSPAVDVIALVGIFALARVFIALAAMDIGTSFGTLGARREMLVSFLAEPALLMVFFTASLICQSTELPVHRRDPGAQAVRHLPQPGLRGGGLLDGLLAENARIPVDNPTTHLELTMIHEAMILEYSARHLALIEWAVALKLFTYSTIGIALFLPWGIAEQGNCAALPLALLAMLVKLLIGGAALALHRDDFRQGAHVPRAGIPRHRLPAGGAGHADPFPAGGLT